MSCRTGVKCRLGTSQKGNISKEVAACLWFLRAQALEDGDLKTAVAKFTEAMMLGGAAQRTQSILERLDPTRQQEGCIKVEASATTFFFVVLHCRRFVSAKTRCRP